MTTEKASTKATPKKSTTKKPNMVVRFFNAVGRGISGFFSFIWNAIAAVIMFIWELIWTILTFVYDLIIKIIQATLKYVLMIWGFILATILIAALTVWLLSLSAKNIDETQMGAKLAPAIEKIAEQINGEVIREIEAEENAAKEYQLKEELKRLQEMRIQDLELQLESIDAE